MSDENYIFRIYDLIDEAASLPTCDQKISLLEEAIALADSHSNVDLGYRVRQYLMKEATFGAYPEKMLVAFAWCLAQCDREPERYNERDMLWKYKWSANRLPDFPQISREQIEETLADMSRRYLRFGSGQKAVLKLRYRIAWELGDHQRALEYHQRWVDTPRDDLTDCPACERDHDIEFYIRIGKYQKALSHAKPILSGRLSCAEIPHATYAQLLFPAFELDRLEEAWEFHLQGYRLIHGKREHTLDACRHLLFLLRIDQLPAALEILQVVAAIALNANDGLTKFQFHRVLRCCIQRAHAAGLSRLNLRLPAQVPGGPHEYDLDALDAWNQQHLDEVVAKFNQRNQNDYYTQQVAVTDRWMQEIKPFSR